MAKTERGGYRHAKIEKKTERASEEKMREGREREMKWNKDGK